MLSSEFLKFMQCTIPHKCSKEKNSPENCTHCEIGYFFIVCEPIMLKCGHQICKECIEKAENEDLLCTICGAQIEIGNIMGQTVTEPLIKMFLNDLSKELAEKYLKTCSIYDESNIEHENNVNTFRQQIKNDIDLDIERVKEQLNELRDEIHARADRLCDSLLKEINSTSGSNYSEKAKELSDSLEKCQMTLDKFYEYQKELKEMIDEVQRKNSSNYEIKYHSSGLSLSSNDFGEFTKYCIRKSQGYILSSSEDGFVKIWNREFKCVGSIAMISPVKCVLPLNDYLIAMACEDMTITLWNLNKGLYMTLEDDNLSIVRCLELVNESQLASGHSNGKIGIWDLENGSLSFILEQNNSRINTLKAIGVNLLASAGYDAKIRIWDLDKRVCVYKLIGHGLSINRIQLLYSSSLASGSEDKTIRIWDLKTQKCVRVIEVEKNIYSLALVEKNVLASGSRTYDGVIYLWDLDSGKSIGELKGHSGCVRALTLLAPNILASACDDRTIKLWNINERKCIKTIDSDNGYCINSLAIFKFN